MYHLIPCFVFLFLVACSDQAVVSDFREEIKVLKTTAAQRFFLESIYNEDQDVRQVDAPEKSMEERITLDNLQLSKIETYLEIHGNPSIEKHGEKAAMTPWLVVHHASGGVAPRQRNFKYIYQAWKTGEIDGGAVTFYLNRMYDIKFGHRMQLKNPFREEFEMDTLIRSLDLQHIRAAVDKKLRDKIEE